MGRIFPRSINSRVRGISVKAISTSPFARTWGPTGQEAVTTRKSFRRLSPQNRFISMVPICADPVSHPAMTIFLPFRSAGLLYGESVRT